MLLKIFNPKSKWFLTNFYIFLIRNTLLGKYGLGIMHHHKHAMFLFAKEILFFSGYTIKDKIHYLLGMQVSDILYYHVIADKAIPNSKFDCHFYIVHGKYDYLVSEKLSFDFYAYLQVPDKKYILFENCAHSH